VNRALHPGKIPVQESPAFSPGMFPETHAVLEASQNIDALGKEIEFRLVENAPFFVGILPDEKDLINRAQGIDLEFVVAVFPGDEDLHVVFRVDGGIPFGKIGLDAGFFHPEPDVKVIIVP